MTKNKNKSWRGGGGEMRWDEGVVVERGVFRVDMVAPLK